MKIEQQSQILYEACQKCGLDGHIVTADKKSELYTWAEKMMGKKNVPHKNSYLYCRSLDACFYIDDDMPMVAIAWMIHHGSDDLKISEWQAVHYYIDRMLAEIKFEIDERSGENEIL